MTKVSVPYIVSFFFLMLAGLSVSGKTYMPEEIENPNKADRRIYVADPENLLAPDIKNSVNKTLYDLRLKTGAEVAVAIIPSIGDMSPEEFSNKLFAQWGLGKSDKDNGLLLIIVPDERIARIETGYGTEGVIPDITARKIIEKDIIPNMRNGDLNQAVASSVGSINNILTDPEVAEELKSREGEAWETLKGPDLNMSDFLNLVFWVVIFIFIVSMVIFFNDWRMIRKKDRVSQAQEWHKRKSTYLSLAVLSLGLGLIPYFLAERQRKRTRNKPMDCPACGGKMVKLGEEEDNSLLSPSQDLEERLDTVDYDVWVCPQCGSVDRFPFKTNQLKYTECPACHTIAMGLVRDHTVVPATTRHTGIGERIYECKYCRYNKRDKYQIPKRPDPVMAAAIGGAMLGRGGHGGSFGGGFGGGRSGGGGATGRW